MYCVGCYVYGDVTLPTIESMVYLVLLMDSESMDKVCVCVCVCVCVTIKKPTVAGAGPPPLWVRPHPPTFIFYVCTTND